MSKESTLTEQVLALEARMGRAATTGSSNGVTVKVSGRGTIDIAIDDSYGLSEKKRQALSADLESAIEQAIAKQRRRLSKESTALLS